ncbi:MAG: DUF3634 family protein [Thermodesulfobacteriota bacterium]|nr:DUF3634 family protein [Thermodesulfobacteriota bacterium]
MTNPLARIFRAIVSPEFTVTIKDGEARSHQGRVSSRVLSEFTEIAKQQSISKARIYGIRRGDDIVLKFSRNISSSDQQRFRNVWGFSN